MNQLSATWIYSIVVSTTYGRVGQRVGDHYDSVSLSLTSNSQMLVHNHRRMFTSPIMNRASTSNTEAVSAGDEKVAVVKQTANADAHTATEEDFQERNLGSRHEARIEDVFDGSTGCEVPHQVKEAAVSVNQISMSIPDMLFHREATTKKRFVSPIVPGFKRDYAYDTEDKYYENYAESIIALTKKKMGWDCLRHYEIILSGAIPFFTDKDGIDSFPRCVSSRLPRKIIRNASQIVTSLGFVPPQKSGMLTDTVRPLSSTVSVQLSKLQEDLMSYAQTNLASSQVAKDFLLRVGFSPQEIERGSQTKKIAVLVSLTSDFRPDYIRDLLIIGLKLLPGVIVVDDKRLDYLYTDSRYDTETLYGMGYTYSKKLDDDVHVDKMRQEIDHLVKARYFDLYIFASQENIWPCWDWNLLATISESHREVVPRVAYIHGQDIPLSADFYDTLPPLVKHSHVFVREGFSLTRENSFAHEDPFRFGTCLREEGGVFVSRWLLWHKDDLVTSALVILTLLSIIWLSFLASTHRAARLGLQKEMCPGNIPTEPLVTA